MRESSRLRVLVVAWLSCGLIECAPPTPHVVVAASCPIGKTLSRCEATPSALSVRQYSAAPLAVGSPVRITGRLVPGARCCWYGCPASCAVQLALVDETERALTPSSGPLVLLTVDYRGQGFMEPQGGQKPVTCSAQFEEDPEQSGSYCCELAVSGQRVEVTGQVVPMPPLGPPTSLCTGGDMAMPMPPSRCQLSAPWRTDWAGVHAIAVDDWCEAP